MGVLFLLGGPPHPWSLNRGISQKPGPPHLTCGTPPVRCPETTSFGRVLVPPLGPFTRPNPPPALAAALAVDHLPQGALRSARGVGGAQQLAAEVGPGHLLRWPLHLDRQRRLRRYGIEDGIRTGWTMVESCCFCSGVGCVGWKCRLSPHRHRLKPQ